MKNLLPYGLGRKPNPPGPLSRRESDVKKNLRIQKLQLTRETLHSLQSADLQAALGGATTTKFICSEVCSNSKPSCTC